jgi:hypothetical protein
MKDEMTIDDAINVARTLGDERVGDPDREINTLACAAQRLARHVEEQRLELERERARRHELGCRDARSDGHRLRAGTDGGGRREFLSGRGVHAGETLYLLTYAGWHAVRYESNMPCNEPVLYMPLPGVREDVIFRVPRQALFVWPEELG